MLLMIQIYFGVLIALYSYEAIRESREPLSLAEHFRFCVSLLVAWILAIIFIAFGVI